MCEFVEDLRSRIIEGLTGQLGISPDTAGMLAAELVAGVSRDWRGERPYIGPPAEVRQQLSARNAALLRDWHNGERIPLLARRYSISVKRVYAVLKLSRAAP